LPNGTSARMEKPPLKKRKSKHIKNLWRQGA
jgi:hypothetical protein